MGTQDEPLAKELTAQEIAALLQRILENVEKDDLNRWAEITCAVVLALKTDPFNNPAAPLGPLKMAEYVQPELAEAKRQDEQSAREYAAAMQANQNADTYVLLTVLFASVLFFGGIAGTLDSRRLRISILSIALALFVVTVVYLGTMPICKE